MRAKTSSLSLNRLYRVQPLNLLTMLLLVLAPALIFSIFGANNTSIYIASIGGCQIFPANNIWNYDISHLLVHRNSANYIKTIATDKLQNDFGAHFSGFPYIVVSRTQPYVPVHFHYADESDPGPYPIPLNAPIENRSDRHVIVVDSATCKLYEMFASYPQTDGSWKASSGAIWNLRSNALRPNGWTSADAAGLPILAGLVRYDEVAAGLITHALRFAVANPQNTYVWPARHTDGPNHSPNSLPEGLRLRLKASVDISSFPPQSRVILTALKHYGMFLADSGESNGHNIALSGAPDRHWNESDLATLTRIHASDFEAVDESSLQVSPDFGQARATVTSLIPTRRPTIVYTASPLSWPTPTNATVPSWVEVTESDKSRGNNAGGGWISLPLSTNRWEFLLLFYRCW